MSSHRRGLTLTVCAFGLAIAPTAAAPAGWKEFADNASRWDTTRQYDKAIGAYKQALSMVPASSLNDTARLNACLAIDLLRSRRYDEGLAAGERCLTLVKELKAANNIDPDTILYTKYLVDACNSEPALYTYEGIEKHPAQQKAMALGLNLKRLIGMESKTTELAERIVYARSFIAVNKDEEAAKELRKILQTIKPEDSLSRPLRSFVAAIEDKHGKPETLQKFDRELRAKKISDASRLEMIGQAQIWCADYKKGLDSLNQALSILGKTTAATANQEIVIRNSIVVGYDDRLDWKNAESQLRKIIEIALKYPPEPKAARRFKILLAENLRRQKRNREADAIDPKYQESLKGRREYDFILNDEERAALKKAGDK